MPCPSAAPGLVLAGQNFRLALAPSLASIVEPHINPLVRGRHLRDPLLNGSGSQQHAKYRSDLQELASLMAGQASGRHSDVTVLGAVIGL